MEQKTNAASEVKMDIDACHGFRRQLDGFAGPPAVEKHRGGQPGEGAPVAHDQSPVDSVDSVDAFAARADTHRAGESE